MLLSRDSVEPAGDPSMVLKLWLIVSGIYIWEFFTTLDYEWSVIRRHRPYRWTVWFYSISRLSGLVVVILALVNFYVSSPINCQVLFTFGWTLSALGCYGLSSILIMFRIFAIWDQNRNIMAISGAMWVINLGFQLAGIVKIRAVWVPAARSCAVTNIEACRGFYITLLVNDIFLLLVMLVGLLRIRFSAGGSFYLSRLLWKQGVIWLVIATAAELPQVLLLYLNVNDSLNVLFLLPSMVAIIIAATRTYRSLIHSASPPNTALDPPNPQKAKRLVSHTKDSSVVHIPSNRLEVTVHTTYDEEYPMSQTNHYGLSPSSDAQPIDKPLELGLNDYMAGHDEKN